MRKKPFVQFASLILFISGLLCLMNLQITAAAIGSTSTDVSKLKEGLLGIFLIISSFLLFISGEYVLEKEIKLSTKIRDHLLIYFSQQTLKDSKAKKEVGSLMNALKKGNFNIGIGGPKLVPETHIFYLKTLSGARLYYHRLKKENIYEILAFSSRNNQDKVIRKLQDIYPKKFD